MTNSSADRSFGFDSSPDPIRADIAEAYRRAWNHIASPGTWLSGEERVAVADETRRARTCALCAERKVAPSPFALGGRVGGIHDSGDALPAGVVDQVHRVTTDAARLSEKWYRGLLADGLTAERYVEALGVAVITISIDQFHHALGLAPQPLPSPIAGEPTRVRPEHIVEGEAWVPMRDAKKVGAALGLPGPAPFVLRALTLVPAEVEAWQDVAGAQYLSTAEMTNLRSSRAIDRSQMELVAGRVSALNECFY